MPEIVILRMGHRPFRDNRVTSHVCLTARAFSASKVIISDVVDEKIRSTVEKIVERWGGPFSIEMGTPWRKAVSSWKEKGGAVVLLTMYGENIADSDVLKRITELRKDLLIIVGSEKINPECYKVCDFQVAVGNEPHAETSALAVFLHEFWKGRELAHKFKGAKLRVIAQKRGKKVIKVK